MINGIQNNKGIDLNKSKNNSINTSLSSMRNPNNAPAFCKSDFEFGKLLGRGAVGRVWLVREKRLGRILALKCMRKRDILRYSSPAVLRRELCVHSTLRHRNVLRLYNWFSDSDNIYLLLEYAPGGDLFALHRPVSEPRARKLVAQTVEALAFCHSRGIAHRDLKLENILLGADGNVRLADFGWSAKDTQRRTTLCGTLDYLAPELATQRPHTRAVDAWALGVLAFELLVGRAPFTAPGRKETLQRITACTYTIPQSVSPLARQFLSSLLQTDPAKRMSLADARRHPWILKPSDSIQSKENSSPKD